MIIAIGADHRGYAQKEYVKSQLAHVTWIDVGTHSQERTDYPVFAHAVCKEIGANRAQQGILFCGTGIGMAITANRYKGIYAGVVWQEDVARYAKEDDNVNVLVIPSDYVTAECAMEIIHAWLSAMFKGERYQKRIDMIDQ